MEPGLAGSLTETFVLMELLKQSNIRILGLKLSASILCVPDESRT